MLKNARVALVHDWLTGMRGGEKVLEVFARLFPNAPIYTLLHHPGTISSTIAQHRIITSSLQRLPLATKKYRYYLPLLPNLIERLHIEPVDLVLSTSSCVAKGIIPPAGARHACYMFSPMRYIYDQFDNYFGPGRAGRLTRWGMQMVRGRMQRWDRASTQRIDSLVGISSFIAERIEAVYDRRVEYIHPPVDTVRFAQARRTPEDYYLFVGALVPYKNVDVAMEAFRHLDRKLIVAGSGPMMARLQAICPPNVELRGWVDDAEIPHLVAGCRAFIFPNVEDFGIAPLEAMAAGRPVIALGAGGALDTIRPAGLPAAPSAVENAPTGILYSDASPQGLANAVREFERREQEFLPAAITAWAKRFELPRFEAQIRDWLEGVLASSRPKPKTHDAKAA